MVDYSHLLDTIWDDAELVALRGARLPTQGADADLLEKIDWLGFLQKEHLWSNTPGSRFKKNTPKWRVGVTASCIGFTLGEALDSGTALDDSNREYLARQLDFAQIGAGSLLEPRESTQRIARTSRVLEAAISSAGVKVKEPIKLMVEIPFALEYSLRAAREMGVDVSNILRPT